MIVYKRGSRGPMVEKIQETLNLCVFKRLDRLEPDGIFGELTEGMVIAFQEENPPLAVDGEIGKDTKPVLAKYFEFWKQHEARQLPVPDVTIGQEKISYDCGYFTAYLIARHAGNHGRLSGLTFSRDELFRLRDEFAKVDVRDHGREQVRKNSNYLKATDAPRFLEFLGSPGYHYDYVYGTTVGNMSDAQFINYVATASGNGRHGVMISAPKFGGTGFGHWFAALEIKQVNKQVYVLIYDSSKAIARQLRSKQMPAGTHLGWVLAHNLKKILKESMTGGLDSGFVSK